MSENSLDLSILLTGASQDSLINIESFFKKMPIRYEIILIGPTPSEVEFPYLRLASFKEAAAKLNGNLIFFMDAKLRIPLAEIIAFMMHFQSNPELQFLNGDRFLPNKNRKRIDQTQDIKTGFYFEIFIQKYFGLSRYDYFCPMKAFRKEIGTRLLSQLKFRNLNEIELFILAHRFEIQIESLSVIWNERRSLTSGPSRHWSQFIKLIFALLYFRLSHWRRGPID